MQTGVQRGIKVGEEGAGCGTVALSQRWDEQASEKKNFLF